MASPPPAVERIFYDGDCGVCHWGVRFIARRDPGGAAFRFAPLGGETFRRRVPAELRAQLPDSLVVETADGRLLLRTGAVVHILRRLGLLWRLLGLALFLIPASLRDFAYDRFAAVRHLLVARPRASCPALPPELRRRFEG